MKYVIKFFSKLILFPIALAMFLLYYLVFILSPDLNKFKLKMER